MFIKYLDETDRTNGKQFVFNDHILRMCAEEAIGVLDNCFSKNPKINAVSKYLILITFERKGT